MENHLVVRGWVKGFSRWGLRITNGGCAMASFLLTRRSALMSQGNTESASTKSEALGTWGVPYKRFEELSVLTVKYSKRIEARELVAEYLFSSLTCSAGTRVVSGGTDGGRTRNEHYFIQWCGLYKTLGERFDPLPRNESPAESFRIAWKRMGWTVVPLKRIGCTQLHKT